METKTAKIQFRRDTKQNFGDIILALGEPAYDITEGKMKIGDGQTPYSQLGYIGNTTFFEPQNDGKVYGRKCSSTNPSAGEWVEVYSKVDAAHEDENLQNQITTINEILPQKLNETQVNALINNKLGNYYNKTQTDTKLTDKLDKVKTLYDDSKYVYMTCKENGEVVQRILQTTSTPTSDVIPLYTDQGKLRSSTPNLLTDSDTIVATVKNLKDNLLIHTQTIDLTTLQPDYDCLVSLANLISQHEPKELILDVNDSLYTYKTRVDNDGTTTNTDYLYQGTYNFKLSSKQIVNSDTTYYIYNSESLSLILEKTEETVNNETTTNYILTLKKISYEIENIGNTLITTLQYTKFVEIDDSIPLQTDEDTLNHINGTITVKY